MDDQGFYVDFHFVRNFTLIGSCLEGLEMFRGSVECRGFVDIKSFKALRHRHGFATGCTFCGCGYISGPMYCVSSPKESKLSSALEAVCATVVAVSLCDLGCLVRFGFGVWLLAANKLSSSVGNSLSLFAISFLVYSFE